MSQKPESPNPITDTPNAEIQEAAPTQTGSKRGIANFQHLFHRPLTKKNKRTWIIASSLLIALALIVSGVMILSSPTFGAQGANTLRGIFGNQAVAWLESVVFQAKDNFEKARYSLGLERPAAPWQSPTDAPADLQATEEIQLPQAIDSQIVVLETNPQPQSTPPVEAGVNPIVYSDTPADNPSNDAPAPAVSPSTINQPVAGSRATPWQLEPVKPMGNLQGEGIWQPYIRDGFNRVVAYRTFLQPDRTRPYNLVGVVAMDLERTRLHYVLGIDEPRLKGGPRGTGKVSAEDYQPYKLLAAFNGGFMATHGQFGAMAGGVQAIPPKDGLATVAIYNDGRVRIGEWGKDMQSTPDMAAWRQNCRMVIQDGQVGSQVSNNSTKDWGGTVDDTIITWRSGIAISKDGRTLYYYAGGGLNVPIQAEAMKAVNAWNAMQLDINNYWVIYTAVRLNQGKFVPEALFSDAMKDQRDRFLQTNGFVRDFFYLTSAETPINKKQD